MYQNAYKILKKFWRQHPRVQYTGTGGCSPTEETGDRKTEGGMGRKRKERSGGWEKSVERWKGRQNSAPSQANLTPRKILATP